MEGNPTPYTHTEQPNWKLQSRVRELNALLEIPHNPDREQQLEHELGCVAFELYGRYHLDGQPARTAELLPQSA